MRQWRRATIATPGEWQCKTGVVRRLAVVNGPNIFQMLLVKERNKCTCSGQKTMTVKLKQTVEENIET